MDANQNPPSERDWTDQEKDEFYASIGLSGAPINKEPFHPSASITYCGDYMAAGSSPLTLDMLVKMKEDLDKRFPEPIKYKDGADMSHETFVALGIPMASKDNGKTWFDHHINPIIGIEIHIVPSLPFGAVEECRCKERYKIRLSILCRRRICQAWLSSRRKCLSKRPRNAGRIRQYRGRSHDLR